MAGQCIQISSRACGVFWPRHGRARACTHRTRAAHGRNAMTGAALKSPPFVLLLAPRVCSSVCCTGGWGGDTGETKIPRPAQEEEETKFQPAKGHTARQKERNCGLMQASSDQLCTEARWLVEVSPRSKRMPAARFCPGTIERWHQNDDKKDEVGREEGGAEQAGAGANMCCDGQGLAAAPPPSPRRSVPSCCPPLSSPPPFSAPAAAPAAPQRASSTQLPAAHPSSPTT